MMDDEYRLGDGEFHTLRFVMTKTKDCGYRIDVYGLKMRWVAGQFCDDREACLAFIKEQFLTAGID